MSLARKIEKYIAQEHVQFEGYEGVKSLTNLVKLFGYGGSFADPLSAFLADNSGALEALVEWISSQSCDEWEESLDDGLREDDDN